MHKKVVIVDAVYAIEELDQTKQQSQFWWGYVGRLVLGTKSKKSYINVFLRFPLSLFRISAVIPPVFCRYFAELSYRMLRTKCFEVDLVS